MKKNLLFLILCTVLCACSTNPEVSDIKGEYVLTGSWTVYNNGEEIMRTEWYKDSVARFYHGEFNNGFPVDSLLRRQVLVEESEGKGYVRTTLFGEPDTLTSPKGRYAPKRVASAVEELDNTLTNKQYTVVIENGVVVIIHNGIRYFISKPIQIKSNNASQVILEQTKPFFVNITSLDEQIIGQAKLQYTYGPIYKHGDQIEWDAECQISIPQAPSVSMECDMVKYHVVGTRVK